MTISMINANGSAGLEELGAAELEAVEGGIFGAIFGGFAVGFAAGLAIAYVVTR